MDLLILCIFIHLSKINCIIVDRTRRLNIYIFGWKLFNSIVLVLK